MQVLGHVAILLLSYAAFTEAGNRCSLRPAVGPCRAAMPRFYFNADTSRCEAFIYGGCRGNANNFRSISECQTACGVSGRSLDLHVKNPICMLPPIEQGQVECRGYFPRYTFDSSAGKCVRYIYGGCSATPNVFSSEEECASACVHQQRRTLRVGLRSRMALASETPEAYNNIVFPGDDICSLPATLPGTTACLAFIPSWTFDSKQAKCVEFIYGGCRGTENLFPTEEACQARCIKQEVETRMMAIDDSLPELCYQPPVKPGKARCLAYAPRFTYDSELGQCVPYIYGGCGGTDNLFMTETECSNICGNKPTVKPTVEVCGQSIDAGPCRASKPMYGFNKDTGRCELFFYGGCDGNGNRFETLTDCVNTCGGSEPLDSSICQAVKCDVQERLYYTSKGCQAIVKPGHCCPTSWDCSRWEERLRQSDKCWVANAQHPRGKFYDIGASIPELNQACQAGCRCRPPLSLGANDAPAYPAPMCAVFDCFSPWGSANSGEDCRQIYGSSRDCCGSKVVCDEELRSLDTCEFEGKTFYQGEKMTSETNPCLSCHCNGNWTGSVTSDNADCYEIDCYSANNQEKLLKGCQPVHRTDRCCPTDWICPEDTKLETEAFTNNEIQCPEGATLKLTNQDLISIYPVNNNSDVCLLPKTSGPCTPPTEDKWFFDRLSRSCKPFKFGGLKSEGGNTFDDLFSCEETCSDYLMSAEEKEKACKPANEEEILIADACMPLRSFRFNSATNRCEDFSRLGCRANRHSFASAAECDVICMEDAIERENEIDLDNQGKDEACEQPVQTGNCKARLSRFYYDKKTGLCSRFWFSGCQGNKNNFVDERDCIRKCVSKDKVPRAIQGSQELLPTDICGLKHQVGPCRAASPSWYYDPDTKNCKLFFYGGCEGNANRFATLKECTKTCPVNWRAQREVRSVCGEPKAETGPCRASTPRWSFDKATGKCERFTYGGCEGNGNNFVSEGDCMLKCAFTMRRDGVMGILPATMRLGAQPKGEDQAKKRLGEGIDPCKLDKEIGRCRGAFPKFFFNKATNQCEGFIYGGCGGNANNFPSMEACQERCSQSGATPSTRSLHVNPVCDQAMDVGPCKAARPQWFHNSTSQTCEQFFWGGCLGNENRFDDRAACQTACITDEQRLRTTKNDLNLLPRPADKCYRNEAVFNRGDKLIVEKCLSCSCSSPPDMTCVRKTCPAELPTEEELLAAQPSDAARCTVEYDEDGCCPLGLSCVTANPPVVQMFDPCARKACPLIGFLPEEGKVCTEIKDEEGCCTIGLDCSEP